MRRLTETRVHGGIAGERVIFRSRLHKCPYSPAHADGRPVYGRPAAGRQRLNHGAAGDVTTADRLTGVDFSGDLHRGYWNAGRRSGSSARHRQRAGLSNAHTFGVQTPRYLLLVQRRRNKSDICAEEYGKASVHTRLHNPEKTGVVVQTTSENDIHGQPSSRCFRSLAGQAGPITTAGDPAGYERHRAVTGATGGS